MKQFCKTSSLFDVEDIKNERVLRDFLQKWKVECRADSLVPMRFAIFPVHLSSTAPATENWCQVIRSAALVTQNHLSKPAHLILQNATPLRKSAPWPPNISHEHVFCTAPATENASLQILFNVTCLPSFLQKVPKPSRFAHFWRGAQSLAPATRNDIWTSKSGPNPQCFVHFDLEMCFAPQRRALFRHLNFQKWSEPSVFCAFWLGNVLRATTACNFSSLVWPDGSAPAALASLLFDPPEPQIIRKTQCFATFLPFRASASSFFWLFLFSDLLSSNLSLLSASALLCFSSVHIVGSLTSKLPSMTKSSVVWLNENQRFVFALHLNLLIRSSASSKRVS